MTHTPGPWEVREERVGDRIVRRVIHDHNRSGRSHKPIATVHEGFTCTEADARLIAAAPDLLAACEALVAFEGHNHACPVARADRECPECNRLALTASDLLRPAIARARGVQP